MSKFMDHVELQFLQERRPDPLDHSLKPISVYKEFAKIPDLELLIGYKIGVRYELRGHCRTKDAQGLRENFLRSLKAAIFDSIRDIELRLNQAYYDRNLDELESALRDLHQEIY